MINYYFNFNDFSFSLYDEKQNLLFSDSFDKSKYQFKSFSFEVTTNWFDRLIMKEKIKFISKLDFQEITFNLKKFYGVWKFRYNNELFELHYKKWHSYNLVKEKEIVSTIIPLEKSTIKFKYYNTFEISIIDNSLLPLLILCLLLFATKENVEGGRQLV